MAPFANTIEPVCWLLDAIRLSGFYPSLKRRIASQSDQKAWPQSKIGRGASFERTLRDHCARVGDPVPENVEEYARSVDFEGGADELAAALERDASTHEAPEVSSLPRVSEPVPRWPTGARRSSEAAPGAER